MSQDASAGPGMTLAIDSWGSGTGAVEADDDLLPAPGQVDVTPEVRAEDWAPRGPHPGVAGASSVLFVDGVQRLDARVWGSDQDGTRQALAVSYAAGAVRCAGNGELRGSGGAPRVEGCLVRRGLFGPAGFAAHAALGAGPTAYPHRVTASDDEQTLRDRVSEVRDQVEVDVATAAEAADLVVIDGPLRGRQGVDHALGYVKTHHASYLPAEVNRVVARLEPGQRTPLFLVQSRWSRWSWYLELPYGSGHPWAGVVRCEVTADLSLAEAVTRADAAAATLPRYASHPHKDPRAPQNLYPIAGLERHLRRLLGDRAHLERTLRAAVA